MKPCFIINNRNKAADVPKAIMGALGQSMPCEIILSDQHSTDGSLEIMRRTVAQAPKRGGHDVRIVECPIEGPTGMVMSNAHFDWLWRQTEAEWIFQCSSDDYSLPDRVRLCMEAVDKFPCAAVATTMFFEEPGKEDRSQMSGYPHVSGYVPPGEGISRLAYGSVIAGYHRSFLEKVGSGGPNTIDVYYGYLAALDRGFYVVANPQHVHVRHAGLDNAGFEGKLRAATGDQAKQLNELNHFQLARVYMQCAVKAQQLYNVAGADEHIVNMMLGQLQGWLSAREILHANGITPGVI